ncbi:adhesion G protein-coupled receptor E3 isoform X2 [Xenopus laevis]|uniref:Adhesion G protein-coupled receptor E3 isoform X2 n=1 Tax=Xenopus laevis TaxID=8355 RepID=A0A8J1MN14_XENLA|nr:adhesion G protein-coupled receptor E3 isoform X2 [Xenopus laevis]
MRTQVGWFLTNLLQRRIRMRTQFGWLLIALCALLSFQGYSTAANSEETNACIKQILCELLSFQGYSTAANSEETNACLKQSYSTAANNNEETNAQIKKMREKNCISVTGFSLPECDDINECQKNPNLCGTNTKCKNTVGGYKCVCDSGYQTKGNKTEFCHNETYNTCEDINECRTKTHKCGANTKCTNTQGGYECLCNPGSVTAKNKTKFTPTDNKEDNKCVDPCILVSCTRALGYSTAANNIEETNACIKKMREENCISEPGFSLPGCDDINECLENKNICGNDAQCKNTVGGYKCVCDSGYQTKGSKTEFCHIETYTQCEEIEEFFSTSQPTTVITITTPSATNPTTCPAGYVMKFTGGVMECSEIEGFFSTSQPTTVINFTTPSATNPTTCPAGYVMNFTGGVMECSEIEGFFSTSQPTTVINFTTPSATNPTTCPAGYVMKFTGGVMECSDVDECLENPSPCGNNSLCKNTAGSFICSCKAGYKEVFQIGSAQLQCVAIKDLCGTYLQEQNKTLSNCSAKDRLCILQQSTYHLLESSCQDNRTKLDIKNITNSASEILSKPSWSALNSSEVSTAVNGLLETVETSVLKSFSKHPTNRNFSTPEIAVATKVVQENCSFLTLNVGLNSMNVSCELLPNPEDGAVFISYRDLNSILSGSLLLELEDLEKNKPAVVVNSQVVTGSITSRKKEKLNPPVTFYLNNLQAPDSSKIFLCVYWDLDLIGWSQRGCNITFSNVSHTLCSCDHLSSFAVIMAPCDIKEDRGLLVVSRIGLSVSLLCLSLSLLTFLLCRSLRSAHTSMLTALSGCLFMGQLIILFGLHQTQFPILCSIIAGCLHYILLCAFCWMTLESVLLFLTVRNLNAMNYLTSRRSHFPTACLIGFGVPAFIVTISAAVRSDGYGTEKSCWLNLNLIWSFLGPVSVFITINTILLTLTLWLLRAKLASLNKNVSSFKNTRLLTFKALAQLFILGSTWVIGFFQFGTGAIVASYLFTICNSLQGAFIFLVHCLLNHQVREEYRNIFYRLHIKKPESETVSGSTIPMTLKSATISEVVKSDTVIDHHSELGKTEWCKTSDDTSH